MPHRVSIVGLGLIGGSLGLALKRAKGADIEVGGYSRRPETVETAVSRGIVDTGMRSLGEAFSGADVAVVAVPLMSTRDVLREAAEHARPGCVITDIGSTKRLVMKWAAEYLPDSVHFVGGHPMAGKETSGLDQADERLFEGCVYCIVPSGNAGDDAVGAVEEMAAAVGALPRLIDAETHDRLVAGVSHLPLLVSSALVSATTSSESWPRMSPLAAGGYRDMTRLASGDPEMSRDIGLSNRDELIAWIDLYMQKLGEYRNLLDEGSPGLLDEFARSKVAREKWLRGDRH